MYQNLTLVGNVGSSPEMRYTPSGVAVTSFSLAVNKRFTNANGETIDKTTWFRVTTWRKLAEVVSEYVKKGSKILIVGEIEEARAFTDRDGNARASIEVTADIVKFLDSRGDGDSHAPAEERQAQPAQGKSAPKRPTKEEDLPF